MYNFSFSLNAFSMHPNTDFTKLLCQQYVLYFLAIALKDPIATILLGDINVIINELGYSKKKKKSANISAVQSQTH